MGVIRQIFQNICLRRTRRSGCRFTPGNWRCSINHIQAVNIDGAVIVTTPQQVAVMDAVRGIDVHQVKSTGIRYY